MSVRVMSVSAIFLEKNHVRVRVRVRDLKICHVRVRVRGVKTFHVRVRDFKNCPY